MKKKITLIMLLLLISPLLFISRVYAGNGGNTSQDIDTDENFIIVTKEFKGLNEGDIAKLDEDFKITVSNGTNIYNLTYKDSYWAEEKTTNGITTWKWKIVGVSAGSYTVSESSYDIDGYEVSATGTGASVTVKAADLDIVSKKETTCSHTDWPLYDGHFFASALTNRGIIVFSEHSFTASQRLKVADYLVGLGGNWKAPVEFYSIEENGEALSKLGENEYLYVHGGKGFKYDYTKKEVILKDTSNWTHVAAVEIINYDPLNPDITITNSYAYNLRELTVTKKWIDHDNIDEIRPDKVTIRLKANDEVVNYNGSETIDITKEDNWTYTFTGLKLNENGTPIIYTIEEVAIDGYIPEINTKDGYTFTITNTHEVLEKNITLTKHWENVDYFLTLYDTLPGIKLVLKGRKAGTNNEWQEFSSIILDKKNSLTTWTHTWGSEGDTKVFLPASYEYKIEEISLVGSNDEDTRFFNEYFIKGEPTKINNNDTTWEITNTCTATYILPETGSSSGLILLIIGMLFTIAPVIYIGYILIDVRR